MVTTLLCLAATAAHAQGYGGGGYRGRQYGPGIQRYGLVFGASIGPGAFGFSDCRDCDSLGALAVQLELGGMVAPNIAIMFDYTGHYHPFDDGSVLSTNLFDGAIRFFFGRIFWIEGGIGIGYLNWDDGYGYVFNQGWGLGGLGAFGIEVLQTYNFALDIQARVSAERIQDNPGVTVTNGAILIGVHWY
jgi:hypothetical protein